MIFAAGRGERMRPLTDSCPKPLLPVGGKPMIAWTIEALVRAGLTDIVINHAWLGAQIEQVLGDGSRFGATIAYSPEGKDGLETAGGVAQAMPLLRPVAGRDDDTGEVFLAVAGDLFCDFDFGTLIPRARELANAARPAMHLVMVPNPPFHPSGDFALDPSGRLWLKDDATAPGDAQVLTFGSIGLYDLRTFIDIEPGSKVALAPYYRAAIRQSCASGERYDGRWENVGTPEQLAALDAQL